MTPPFDFESEGLLDGLEGEQRGPRGELPEERASDGVTLEEMKRAVAEDRLVFLPTERILASGGRYTAAEVAELSGLDPVFQERQMRALGIALGDPEDRAFDDEDVEAAKAVKLFLDAGIPEKGVLEVSRVLGDSMAKLAAAIGHAAREALVRPGDTERDLGMRYLKATRELVPFLGPLVAHALALHQRETAKNAVITQADIAAGNLQGAEDICVCFADLVAFPRIGEDVYPVNLGRIGNRLTDLAVE